MPKVATPQAGSSSSTCRKAFSPAENQNECSIATARCNSPCTLASQLVGKETLPTTPAWASASCASAIVFTPRATTRGTNAGISFMEYLDFFGPTGGRSMCAATHRRSIVEPRAAVRFA